MTGHSGEPRTELASRALRDYHVITEDPMKTRIVRIGNSQGVRLPRPLLETAGLGEDVVVRATPGRIVIEAARAPRAAGRTPPRRCMQPVTMSCSTRPLRLASIARSGNGGSATPR